MRFPKKSDPKDTSEPTEQDFSTAIRLAREEIGLTLLQASRISRLPESFIKSLESNRQGGFKHGVYTRGKLESYIKAIEVPSTDILELYDAVYGELTSSSKSILSIKNQRTFITSRIVLIAIFGSLATITLAYLLWQAIVLSSPPSLRIEFPAQDINAIGTSVELRGKSTKGSNIFINGVEVHLNPDGSFEFEVGLHDGVNTILVEARNRLGRSSTQERTILARTPSVAAFERRSIFQLSIETSEVAQKVTLQSEDESLFDGYIMQNTSALFELEGDTNIEGLASGMSLRYLDSQGQEVQLDIVDQTRAFYDQSTNTLVLE